MQRVTFRGDNGKYLKASWVNGQRRLEFSSDSRNGEEMAFERTSNTLEGESCLIKSVHFGKYLRTIPSNLPVIADVDHPAPYDIATMFKVEKLGGQHVALRNISNKNYCRRSTEGEYKNFLCADATTVVDQAKLLMEEV